MLNLINQLPDNGCTMVDMFCGAGIGAVGFKASGYKIIYAFDNKQYAVDTYNKNIGNHAIIKDIRKLKEDDVPYADVYVGGFPCQPFSEAGSQLGDKDKKLGDMGYHFYRMINTNQPKVFIGENVKGLTFKKHSKFLNQLLDHFDESGYNVTYKLINCFDYGVPQDRERVFIVGVRKDLNKTFKFPEETNDKKVLLDAIGNLPEPNDNCGFKNHSQYYDGGFSPRYISRNRQRQWHEPSFTIVSTARQLPLHPNPSNYDIRKTQLNPPRRFTVRECLRIQTVPDWFSFDDSIDLLKQYERCSGIPSYFAYILGQEIYNQILKV